MHERQSIITPLRVSQVSCVIMIQLCEALNVNVLFPFFAFMVENFGYTGNRLGYYAAWGMLSDWLGRKPTIIVGTLGAAVGMFIFGSAKTYTQAVKGRMIGGLLSGNLGVLKSFLTEITDDSNRGKGFSYLSMAWAVGTIVAPLAGGLLCKPVEKYPDLFSSSSIFASYPYLLPCLLCVAFNVVSSTICGIFMIETRKSVPNDSLDGIELVSIQSKDRILNDNRRDQISREQQQFTIEINSDDDEIPNKETPSSTAHLNGSHRPELSPISQDLPSSKSNQSFPTMTQSLFAWLPTTNRSKTRSSLNIEYTRLPTVSTDLNNMNTGERVQSFRSSTKDSFSTHNPIEPISQDSSDKSSQHETNQHLDPIDDESDSEVCLSYQTVNGNSHGNGSKLSTSQVLSKKLVVLTTLNYGFLCMAYILLEETIPLFLKLDVSLGGFSFNSTQIGLLLSSSGTAIFLFTFFFLPTISKASKILLFEIGILVAIPLAYGWPVLAVLQNYITNPSHVGNSFHFTIPANASSLQINDQVERFSYLSNHWAAEVSDHPISNHSKEFSIWIIWGLLLMNCIMKSMVSAVTFTASMIQVNHSVTEDYLGAVNGLGQSLGSLARGIGPALGGYLWSVSIERHFVFLNFIAVTIILMICFIINRQLPASIELKKKSKKKKQNNESVVPSNDEEDVWLE